MPDHHKASGYTSLVVFIAALTAIALGIQRQESITLMMAYFTAFFCYAWMVKMIQNHQLLFGLGIAARLMMFFHLPGLSDDIYRFLWDGHLTAAGINPYLHTPNELANVEGIDTRLLEHLNSPDYHSIYPPLNQALFWLASMAGQGNLLLSTNFLRLILMFGEIGSYYLLLKLSNNDNTIANWYFLNPLVILEVVGNVHFEGLVIFFLLLALYALKKNQQLLSGLGFGLAAATKLIPLIVLPFILFSRQWRKGWMIVLVSLIVFALSFVSLDSNDFLSILTSVRLYVSTFEFNASIYYLFREIGFAWKGYNIIHTLGPVLAVISFLSIMWISILGAIRKWDTITTLLFIFSIYLLFATTIHPWYLLTLLPLGLLAGYYYPLVWTFLIFITYMGYKEIGYQLPMGWVVFEYVVVLAIASIEIYRKNFVINNE